VKVNHSTYMHQRHQRCVGATSNSRKSDGRKTSLCHFQTVLPSQHSLLLNIARKYAGHKYKNGTNTTDVRANMFTEQKHKIVSRRLVGYITK